MNGHMNLLTFETFLKVIQIRFLLGCYVVKIHLSWSFLSSLLFIFFLYAHSLCSPRSLPPFTLSLSVLLTLSPSHFGAIPICAHGLHLFCAERSLLTVIRRPFQLLGIECWGLPHARKACCLLYYQHQPKIENVFNTQKYPFEGQYMYQWLKCLP